MAVRPTVLVIDDEEDIVDILDFNLRREGFDVRRAHNGKEAHAALGLEPAPDAIILDLMLPDASGTDICRRIRENPRTAAIPVLMLTAKEAERDRVVGFEVGADDYVTKPFSVRELVLRVRALLRRAAAATATSRQRSLVGLLRLDSEAHRVWVKDEEVRLTALEFRLLTALMDRAGRVQSRDRLLDDVWVDQTDLTTRTVDTHVTRLRKKLGAAGEYIETIRGSGYRFRELAEIKKADRGADGEGESE